MAPSKREREYARKRQAKWEERQREKRERRRRIGVIVAILAVFALVAGGAVVAGMSGSQAGDTAADAPTGTACPAVSTDARDGGTLPDPAAAEGRTWEVSLDLCVDGTTETVALELDGERAPQAVASFVSLAEQGYFDATACHRLVTQGIHVLQCGDPTASGTGGPGYSYGPVENAPADDVYPAGTLAMARRGGDAESMGSQFFLVYEDSTIPSDAAGGYTVFGTVTSGLDVVQAVADAGTTDGAADGSPTSPVIIEGVETQ
ncbi:peptidyl-prolyl cis-trans isomerase B (cyclophilin B) [Isoptericola sp. CG 20/1183]|uniref:Peptidyl-prolyl cis-trans isomerase B (Cyclophilin B) n=1 Tax=Isoptericola halotolerans TaxID=300560 RepID=A0ABX5EBB3_9MICO|nr:MULTISPECIES: peptidylprolyl isomerase [Isoptericola]PRZ04390.1 peptidyl-prolyl cis-trans isomerase B (cyclophilin B) [Isoptericola halotolerans]PRZ04712.1 peptidyl-prolyl cis-trans isomerase B (cyclophilin B) [Isoptericola sp. CG 20/1183]